MRQTWARQGVQMVMMAAIVVIGERAESAQTQTQWISAPAAASATRRVVVSLPHRKLAVLVNDRVVRVFDVAVGAPRTPSPVGRFTIVNRLTDPGYYKPGKVIGPGSSNPLGTRWLGLDIKGYGIHGTDDPQSIGHARSHGCIRLRNRDVEQLFEMLRPGDVVELQGEPAAEIIAERLSDKVHIMMVPTDGKFFSTNDVLRTTPISGLPVSPDTRQ